MEYQLFKVSCTFSYLGTEEECREFLKGKSEIIIDNSEFVGTDKEHHSGSFIEVVSVNKGERLVEVVKNYFLVHNEELVGECFTVSTMEGFDLFTEYDVDINSF